MKKNFTALWVMLAVAVIAIVFGLYVVNQRIKTPSASNQQAATETPPPAPAPDPQPTPPPLASTANWSTYTNDKHGFTVDYPPSLKAGSVSDNSVLGTAQVPVRGLHVGPLVIVALEDLTLKQDALTYFNNLYASAGTTAQANPSAVEGDIPPIQCTIDQVSNTKVVSLKSVSCAGEGGPAKYAYISGPTYDVFIDGYSKGFDNQSNGSIASDTEYATILSTFTFTK